MLRAAAPEHDRDAHLAQAAHSSPPDPSRARCGNLQACGTTWPLRQPHRPRPGTAAFPLGLRLAGYAVHLYTASGSVLGLLIVVAAVEGHATTALWLGLATLFIDGTDGMLARHSRVKETIPWFDGALLDNIVDYLTYVFAPVVLLWTTHRLPAGVWGWVLAALPLLASSYQFCRVDAKTDDHFFLGLPELLEHRRLLRDRAGPRPPGDGGRSW